MQRYGGGFLVLSCAFAFGSAFAEPVLPTDHHGEDLIVAANTAMSGEHVNIDDFVVESGITMRVVPYDGLTSATGRLVVRARRIVVLGAIDASEAGYTGGGGGGGIPRIGDEFYPPGAPGRACYGNGRFDGDGVLGSPGDGVKRPGQDVVYSWYVPDPDPDSVNMGNGGRGGDGSRWASGAALGGRQGGRGGGAIMLFAREDLVVEGTILSRGEMFRDTCTYGDPTAMPPVGGTGGSCDAPYLTESCPGGQPGAPGGILLSADQLLVAPSARVQALMPVFGQPDSSQAEIKLYSNNLPSFGCDPRAVISTARLTWNGRPVIPPTRPYVPAPKVAVSALDTTETLPSQHWITWGKHRGQIIDIPATGSLSVLPMPSPEDGSTTRMLELTECVLTLRGPLFADGSVFPVNGDGRGGTVTIRQSHWELDWSAPISVSAATADQAAGRLTLIATLLAPGTGAAIDARGQWSGDWRHGNLTITSNVRPSLIPWDDIRSEGVTINGMPVLYPGTRQGDLRLTGRTFSWGRHSGLSTFELAPGAVVEVRQYDGADPATGTFSVDARRIRIAGRIDARGAGYTGGGGGGGGESGDDEGATTRCLPCLQDPSYIVPGGLQFTTGGRADYRHETFDGAVGTAAYPMCTASPYCGWERAGEGGAGAPGDGPFAGQVGGIMDGGYGAAGSNGDLSTGPEIAMGSGGAGVDGTDGSPHYGNGFGGDGGGRGGGAVALMATESVALLPGSQINADGCLGSWDASVWDVAEAFGGDTWPPCDQTSAGAGAGGGILLQAPLVDIGPGGETLSSKGGRTSGNGGTVKLFADEELRGTTAGLRAGRLYVEPITAPSDSWKLY